MHDPDYAFANQKVSLKATLDVNSPQASQAEELTKVVVSKMKRKGYCFINQVTDLLRFR